MERTSRSASLGLQQLRQDRHGGLEGRRALFDQVG
jgi:hypothetical protein